MTAAPKTGRQTATALSALREMIFSGELAPGSNHLETELALRLGVSRTPVREAAMILQSQGLVEVQARRGVRILPLSVEDMEEIYDLLTILECKAAAEAAARGVDAMALGPLLTAIARMQSALAKEDRLAWAQADDDFHAGLVALSANSRLRSMVAQMMDQVRRARRITLFLRPLPKESTDDHGQLVAAILAGDAAKAEQIHRAHRLAAKALLIGFLRQSQLKQL